MRDAIARTHQWVRLPASGEADDVSGKTAKHSKRCVPPQATSPIQDGSEKVHHHACVGRISQGSSRIATTGDLPWAQHGWPQPKNLHFSLRRHVAKRGQLHWYGDAGPRPTFENRCRSRAARSHARSWHFVNFDEQQRGVLARLTIRYKRADARERTFKRGGAAPVVVVPNHHRAVVQRQLRILK